MSGESLTEGKPRNTHSLFLLEPTIRNTLAPRRTTNVARAGAPSSNRSDHARGLSTSIPERMKRVLVSATASQGFRGAYRSLLLTGETLG